MESDSIPTLSLQNDPARNDKIHGFIYQLKLLMLFLHRGIKHRYNFFLRTEVIEAGSFDDIYFEYEENNKTFFRLLQAKHSLDENKKITTTNLLAGMHQEQKYSLIKYYNSYMKCKNEKLFKAGSFKDLIICTNIDFDLENLESNNITVHPVKEEEDILYIDNGRQKKPMRYRFDESLADKLIPELEKNYDSTIVKDLVNFVLREKPLHKNYFGAYANALVSDVIDKKNKRLHDNFVSNSNLSSRVSEFRAMFEKELQKQSKNELNLFTLNQELVNGKNLIIPQGFGLNPNNKSQKWPQNIIEDKDDPDSSIAKMLVSLILNNNPIIKDQFGTFADALFSEVINIENKTLHKNFVLNKNLSSRVSKFRPKFKNELRKQSNNKLNLMTLNKALVNGVTFKRDIPQGHGQNLNEKENLWPQKVIEKKNVLEFLKLLIFAVNQINEDELGKAIEKEIGDQFNKITSETIYNRLFRHMVDFLQEKKPRIKSKFRFWSFDEGKDFIKNTCFEIIHLQLSGYRDHLDSIKCYFKETLFDQTQEYLMSDKPLWILTSETPWLSTVAVYQSIRSNKHNMDVFIYKWNDLLQNNGKILLDFNGLDDFLIIISCLELIGTENITAQLVTTIDQLFFHQEGTRKKIIVITSENHELRHQLLLKQENCHKEILNIGFGDMNEESQFYLLEKENINFQGNHLVNLQKLLKISDVGSQQQFGELLDASTIEIFLRNSSINIFDQTHDFNSITYKPNKYVTFDNIIKEMIFNIHDIFAFYGNDEAIKILFKDQKIDLLRFNVTLEPNLILNHHYILLDEERHSTDFNVLCKIVYDSDNNKPTLHKLKYLGNENWIWRETFNSQFYINRYYNSCVLGKRMLKLLVDLHFFKNPECIFFSGLTKDEVLTEVYKYYHDKNIKFDKTLFERNCIIASSAETATEEFNFLSKTGGESSFHNMNDTVLRELREFLNYNKNIFHWIELQKVEDLSGVETLRLEWRQSSGNIITVKNRRNLDKNPEETLIRLDKRITLLADAPGTGKSSTLTRVIQSFKKNKPNSLVVEINLSKLQKSVVSFYVNSNEQLINMLFRVVKKSDVHIIERKIMEYKMYHQEQLILLFDGFEEISNELQESALNLFKFIIHNTKATLWITTGLQNLEKLERSLNILSYSFIPLNQSDQINFLSHFWKNSFKFSGKHSSHFNFEKYAETFVHHFDSVLESSSFIQIILMLRSVAETCLDVFHGNAENISIIDQKIREISLTETLESFICHIYDIYFFEKLKISEWFEESQSILINVYSDAYGYLAAKRLCHYTSDLDTCLGKLTKKLSLPTLSNIGLIQICNSLNTYSPSHLSLLQCDISSYDFIHPSLAQYFAAEFICIELKNKPDMQSLWEFLINKILLLPWSLRVFDDKLENDTELADLSSQYTKANMIFNLLNRQVVMGGRAETLWKAAIGEKRRTIAFLIKWLGKMYNYPVFNFIFNFFSCGIASQARCILHLDTITHIFPIDENSNVVDDIIYHEKKYHIVFNNDYCSHPAKERWATTNASTNFSTENTNENIELRAV